jgi:predicted DNA-binding transcriptional regulator AlpA
MANRSQIQIKETEQAILSVQQLARYIGKSVKWVYNYSCQDLIPGKVNLLGGVGFRKDMIDKWINENTLKPYGSMERKIKRRKPNKSD